MSLQTQNVNTVNPETYQTIELKNYKQFACIKHGEKRPINPNTGQYASVTAPKTWCSFEDAVEGVESGKYAGYGFILTENDPFAVIDLDVKEGQQPTVEQNEISKYFSDSYQEYSISGRGLHIVCKCNEAFTGKRKEGIELYSKERFIIFTGKSHLNNPITDRTEDLKKLWVHLNNGEAKQDLPTFIDQPATKSDDEVIEQVMKSGVLEKKYPSPSEKRFAVCNKVVFFSKNFEQSERLLKTSDLYDEKIHTLKSEINKSFTNIDKFELPSVINDLSKFTSNGKTYTDVKNAANDSNHEADILNLKSLLNLAKTSPDIEFTIPLLTPKQEVTLLSANGGVGKSYFALQTAISLITGNKFFDLPSINHDLYGFQPSKKVLFVTAEDTKLVCAKRLQTICESQHLPESTFDNFHLMEMIGNPLWLEDKINKQSLPTVYMHELETVIDKIKPDQIFIDNASSVFAGNPNDSVQVTAFINHLRKIAERTNCNIMLLAHVNADNATNKGLKSYFGSVAWHNAVRSRIYMKLESNDLGECISVNHEKSNYGKLHEQFKLKRNPDNGLLSLLSNMEVAQAIDNNISNLADELFEDIKTMTDEEEHLYCATSGQKTSYKCLNAAFPNKYKEDDRQMNRAVKLAIHRLSDEKRIVKSQIKNNSRNFVDVWIPTVGEGA